MIEIKDLLLKWSNTLLSEEVKKETIREIISTTAKIKLQKSDIKIKGGTVYLNLKPIYKSQILLKREEIDQNLEKILGTKKPKDIR